MNMNKAMNFGTAAFFLNYFCLTDTIHYDFLFVYTVHYAVWMHPNTDMRGGVVLFFICLLV